MNKIYSEICPMIYAVTCGNIWILLLRVCLLLRNRSLSRDVDDVNHPDRARASNLNAVIFACDVLRKAGILVGNYMA